MMNSAADGQPTPAATAAAAGTVPSSTAQMIGGVDTAARATVPGVTAAAWPAGAGAAAVGEPSSKTSLVARYAEEQGVVFLPRAAWLHDRQSIHRVV